jgi:ABC-type lipoprotein release transport system permease subunit
MMLTNIAWRNIWRNRTRSLVIIGAVALGLWGGIFIMALSIGMSEQRKNDVITSQISHIQLHHLKFKEDRDIKFTIQNGLNDLQQIRQMPNVKAATARGLVMGMASSPSGASGVMIAGILPEYENVLTGLKSKLIEGEFLNDKQKHPIIIGRKLAEKLKLKLRSKLVLTSQDTANNTVAGAFRVVGIYKTYSSKYDEMNIFINLDGLKEMLGMQETPVHEIALLCNDASEVPGVQAELINMFPGLLVENWKQISPELQYLDEMMDYFLYIFIGIILFALAFGLVNTMLMAVLERIRELGMLMAIGMNKWSVFRMILLETVFLSVVGGIAGLVLGWVSVTLSGMTGINLSFVQKGLEEFGMGATIYPMMGMDKYPVIAIMVVIFAILSAIYPAIKALKLKPVEAIRKI